MKGLWMLLVLLALGCAGSDVVIPPQHPLPPPAEKEAIEAPPPAYGNRVVQRNLEKSERITPRSTGLPSTRDNSNG